MADTSNKPAGLTPDQIFDIVLRWRWVIVLPLCVTLTVGLYLAFTLPRTYQASTTILVQPQSVPGSYVRSIVTTDINERISTISQQILSQSNLEKIIDQFGLFQGEGAKGMYLEDKIQSMRKRINVKLTRARGGTDAFTISFIDKEPETVMRIVNTLATYFMDENLKVREAQAIGTSEFLDSELEKTRKKLEEMEKQLSDYRARYLGGLPDELESNLRTLDRLQLSLTDKQSVLRQLKSDLTLVQNQIAALKKPAASSGGDLAPPVEPDDETAIYSDNAVKLQQARRLLDYYLLKYTELHPDVIKLKKTVEKLEAIVAQENESQPQSRASAGSGRAGSGGSPPPNATALERLQFQQQEILADISATEADIRQVEQDMNLYEQRVEDTPKREQELLSLRRDYGNIQDVYNSLLDRKLEAELALNMEKKQKGEQFRILDAASLPQKPLTPNIKKLIVLTLGAGLAVAGGIIFLFEFLDHSIRRDEEIEEELGLKIIASIPRLKKPGEAMKKRLEYAFLGASVLYVVGLLGCFAIINMKGIGKVVEALHKYI